MENLIQKTLQNLNLPIEELDKILKKYPGYTLSLCRCEIPILPEIALDLSEILGISALQLMKEWAKESLKLERAKRRKLKRRKSRNEQRQNISKIMQTTHRPGEVLKEMLLRNNITAASAAIRMGWSAHHMYNTLGGKRRLTRTDCGDLANLFNTTVQFWRNVQSYWNSYVKLRSFEKLRGIE